LIAQNISLRADADTTHCRQVVAATAYLHSHSIVHRDLKPENILYKTRDPNSQLVIADFGIAKHLEPDEELTCTAGSVGYAAPEVLTGKGHGMKVDLWSIGWVDRLFSAGRHLIASGDGVLMPSKGDCLHAVVWLLAVPIRGQGGVRKGNDEGQDCVPRTVLEERQPDG
jgi:serine/threonine protein kinase